MTINVLAFGQVADIVNEHSLQLTSDANTDTVKKMLEEKFPLLTNVKYSIAVNKKVINSNTPLHDNSVVALLPPFAGG